MEIRTNRKFDIGDIVQDESGCIGWIVKIDLSEEKAKVAYRREYMSKRNQFEWKDFKELDKYEM